MPKRKSFDARRKTPAKHSKKPKLAATTLSLDDSTDRSLDTQEATASTEQESEPDDHPTPIPNQEPPSILTTPAARFIAVPELRQLLLRTLDKKTLAAFARVKKEMLADVAGVLYEQVDYGRARTKMRRDTPRGKVYCDAVRTVSLVRTKLTAQLAQDVREFDPAPYGQPANLPRKERFILYVHHLLAPKFPNIRHIAWTDRNWVTVNSRKEDSGGDRGLIVGPTDYSLGTPEDMGFYDAMDGSSPGRPLGLLEFGRKVTAINLVVPYLACARPFEDLDLPGPVRLIESLEISGTIQYIASLVQLLSRLDSDATGGDADTCHRGSEPHDMPGSSTTCFARLSSLIITLPPDDNQAHISIKDLPRLLELIHRYLPNLASLRLGIRWEDMSDEVLTWELAPRTIRLQHLFVEVDEYLSGGEGVVNVLLHFAALLQPCLDPLPCSCNGRFHFKIYGRDSRMYRSDWRRPRYKAYEQIVRTFVRFGEEGMRLDRLAKQDLPSMGLESYRAIQYLKLRPDGFPVPFEAIMAQHLLDQIDQLDEQERFNRPVDDAAICALRHIAADDTGIETRSEQLALLQALAAADEYRGFPDDIEPNGEWTDDYDAGTDDGHSDSSGDSDDDIHPTELGNLAIDEQAARARWLDPEPPSDDADAASDADDADDAGDADDAMDPACDAVKAFEALETYIKDKKITNWRCDQESWYNYEY